MAAMERATPRLNPRRQILRLRETKAEVKAGEAKACNLGEEKRRKVVVAKADMAVAKEKGMAKAKVLGYTRSI